MVRIRQEAQKKASVLFCFKKKYFGQLPEWPNGADCNSADLRLRWFESITAHLLKNKDAEIDWQGAQQIRKMFNDAVLIFILPPSLEVLAQRLSARNTDSQEVIEKRLSLAMSDISHAPEFDYLIVNDNFETALQDLCSIIRAPRNKTVRMLEQIKTQFNF